MHPFLKGPAGADNFIAIQFFGFPDSRLNQLGAKALGPVFFLYIKIFQKCIGLVVSFVADNIELCPADNLAAIQSGNFNAVNVFFNSFRCNIHIKQAPKLI